METKPTWAVAGPSDGVVEGWSVSRLPFEPKGAMLDFRAELCLAIRGLVASADRLFTLTAVYCSEDGALVDTENVLFYNVGSAIFGRPGTIHFERRFTSPSPAPAPRNARCRPPSSQRSTE